MLNWKGQPWNLVDIKADPGQTDEPNSGQQQIYQRGNQGGRGGRGFRGGRDGPRGSNEVSFICSLFLIFYRSSSSLFSHCL